VAPNQAADMNRLDLLEVRKSHWSKMLEFSAENDPPAIVTISKSGEFSWYLHQSRLAYYMNYYTFPTGPDTMQSTEALYRN
jgi:hypothetical protein